MLFHWEESATTKTAPFRRNPSGAGGFGPQALSLVGHDEKTSLHSSLRACNPKTPARGPRDFCHGLLAGCRQLRPHPWSDIPTSLPVNRSVLIDWLQLSHVTV